MRYPHDACSSVASPHNGGTCACPPNDVVATNTKRVEIVSNHGKPCVAVQPALLPGLHDCKNSHANSDFPHTDALSDDLLAEFD